MSRKIAEHFGAMCQVLRYGAGGGLNKEMLEGVMLGLEQSLDSSGRKIIPEKKTAITFYFTLGITRSEGCPMQRR